MLVDGVQKKIFVRKTVANSGPASSSDLFNADLVLFPFCIPIRKTFCDVKHEYVVSCIATSSTTLYRPGKGKFPHMFTALHEMLRMDFQPVIHAL